MGPLMLMLFKLLLYSVEVRSHGRLFKPPGRSSAWRYGFNTPKNYNDHEVYCGGFGVQQRNGGKCGPCGDAWHLPPPRPNESGGLYGTGVIVAKYRRGAKIEVGVELTANHMGYFEFRLCQHNRKAVPETKDCFDKFVLKREDGKGTRYYIGPGSKFSIVYRLPNSITCRQCVLQWRYIAGNNWGKCPNGTGLVGCGPQEEFRACADISIVDEDSSADDTPHISIDDYDDYDDYNEIDVEDISVPSSYGGHIAAITLAFVFAFLLIVGLIVLYFWTDILQGFSAEKRGSWLSKLPSIFLIPTLNTGDTKKVYNGPRLGQTRNLNIRLDPSAPVPPPRRNRSRSPILSNEDVSHEPKGRKIYSISAPTRVSINGVEVTRDSGTSRPSLNVPT